MQRIHNKIVADVKIRLPIIRKWDPVSSARRCSTTSYWSHVITKSTRLRLRYDCQREIAANCLRMRAAIYRSRERIRSPKEMRIFLQNNFAKFSNQLYFTLFSRYLIFSQITILAMESQIAVSRGWQDERSSKRIAMRWLILLSR